MPLLDCLEIGPLRAPATASVVWMHGLGADAHDFEPVVPHLHLPTVRFVFPNAPRIPVTINGGFVMPAWYDILTWDRVPERENADHIRASAQAITALVAREKERGIPADRIVLAGFSQGAAMALHTGLRHPEALAGLVILSGYLIVEDTLAAERHPTNAATPIFFGHGTSDDVVPIARGRAAFERVQEGREAEFHSYPIPHSVSMPEIADLRSWLHRLLDTPAPTP